MSDIQGWAAIFVGIGAVGTLLLGLYKLKPESSRIFVDSARVSVEMSNTLRDDLLEQVKTLNVRMTQCETSRLEAEKDIRELQRFSWALLGELHKHDIDIPPNLSPPGWMGPPPELPN